MTQIEYEIKKAKLLSNLNTALKTLKNTHLHYEIDRVKKKIIGLHSLKKWGKGKYGKHFTAEMVDEDILKNRHLLFILLGRLNKTELSPNIKKIDWSF